MAFIPLPNTAQVELRYLLDNQNVETTLYFTKAEGLSPDDLEGIGEGVRGWWLGLMQARLAQNIALREIYVTDQSDQFGGTATITTGLPANGTASTDAAPNNVALCVSFRTARRGRSYRGRNFVPGIPKGVVIESHVTDEYAAGVQAAYNALPASLGQLGYTWVIASRQVNSAPRVVGEVTPVTAAVVIDPTVDSQRRRLPGRGV